MIKYLLWNGGILEWWNIGFYIGLVLRVASCELKAKKILTRFPVSYETGIVFNWEYYCMALNKTEG